MNKFVVLFFSLISVPVLAQQDSVSAVQEIKQFQKELNEEYRDAKKSPLEPGDFKKFKGHPFFPIDLTYRVKARLTVTSGTLFFQMKTTTERLPNYRIYGMIEFALHGKEFKMPVYQSQDLLKSATYADYLFFPFTDLTNGKQTYGGGRYIELRLPKEGTELIVDFNRAYNPYCAYSHRYSCPLVPTENDMDIEVLAGVKYRKKK